MRGPRPLLDQAGPLLRAFELSALLGISSGRIYQLIAAGDIPAVRFGRAVRIPRAALETWLKGCASDARRNARQAAAKRMGSRVPTQLDGALLEAIRLLSEDWPFGWRGTATQLLNSIEQYREASQSDPVSWPRDGRSLSIAVRRLVGVFGESGVRLELGHRGHAGRRLISVTVDSSSASPRGSGKAASGAGPESSHTRGGRGGAEFTGRLRIDAGVLAKYKRSTAELPEFDNGTVIEFEGDE